MLPTGSFDTVYEGLHLVVTFGLICIEVGASADDPPTPVPKLTMSLVLPLTMIGTWENIKYQL